MDFKELIKFYKKPILTILVFFIVLLLLWGISNTKSTEDKIKSYIITKGFILDTDKILYNKRVSDTTKDDYDENVKNKIDSTFSMLYFDIYSYTLTENLYDYTDGVESFLSANYDYKDNKITYNYQVTYETSNIIYRGTYNNNKFKCENQYAFDAYIEESEEDYCNAIKGEIIEFKNRALETITSTRILNYMKK